MKLIKSHFEKILLIAAGVAWLLAGAWCWRREAVVPQPLRRGYQPNVYYQPAVPTARPEFTAWEPPVAQPAGSAWIYEVFSPPLIHRDAHKGAFAAGPTPVSVGDRLKPEISLLGIRAAPYRVQLQGGFGLGDGYVAVLVAVETAEVWCAKPGERWATMGLVLEESSGGFVAFPSDDRAAEQRHVARAVVRDEMTGERVALVAGVQVPSRDLLATIRLPGSSETRDLREGDTWRDGESAYRVDWLSMDPVAGAVVTKVGPGGEEGETWLPLPSASAAGAASRAVRAESPSNPYSSFNRP